MVSGAIGAITSKYNEIDNTSTQIEQIMATQKELNEQLKTIRYSIAVQDSAVKTLSVEVGKQYKQVQLLKNVLNNDNQ